MHIETGFTLLSVIIVSLLSFIGILALLMKKGLLEKIVLYLVSFAVGALFGDTFIHLLPEAAKNGFSLTIASMVLTGILFSFIIEKIIHWRHCHVETSKNHPHPFAYVNLIGDGIHNFIDGILIAGSYMVNIPTGIATTLAVILHEIPQEFGDFGILVYAGFSKMKALLFNFFTALTAVIGALLTLYLGNSIENLTLYLIPFTAGTFLYIAGSDLVPELHKQTALKKSLAQFLFVVLGIGLMFALLLLE